ncbi:Na(+)-translocating NADH-quinone reductase subunit C [Salinisphaera sp. PC39]|uniref:Na(+)-translocating NADH-quinone reductase subunit C n=1 Tax=Salinisphaera sp. PC39 TaxID=1304156 RepID=UPI00333F390D
MPGLLTFSRDGVAYIVVFALAVCLVCSVFVAASAVYLKPLQVANAQIDKRRNILQVAELYQPGDDVNEVFNERLEPRIVNLETGEFAEDIDPAEYDQREAARDPQMSVNVPRGEDIAGIKRRAKYAEVYLARDENGELSAIILPVHGYGLWSTMYGFLALEPDANTVIGLKFYEQGETPGLGGEVENPKWRALWDGKKVYGEDGEVRLSVIKGAVGPDTPQKEHKVDGLSGATLTSRGVSSMIHYWLGERGFEPFLDRIREQSESV